MRVLVTGVAGFIGSHIAERLLAAGHEVGGVDNISTGRRSNLPADVYFVHADIDDGTFTLKPFPADLIIHCAASYDDGAKWHRDTEVNVKGSANVAIAAQEWGARVVYFQTALIYGNNPMDGYRVYYGPDGPDIPVPLSIDFPIRPENSYAISKYAGGQYLRHSGVPLLEFRLANIYGPRNLSGPVPAFYKRLTEGQPCTIVDTRRDFVYINDLCDLVMQAIDSEATGTYHVSTGRDYPIAQVYDAVQGALDAYAAPEPTFQPRGDDDAPTILLDPTETVRDFGWQATTDLDEGVEKAVEWYRANPVDEVYTHLAVKG